MTRFLVAMAGARSGRLHKALIAGHTLTICSSKGTKSSVGGLLIFREVKMRGTFIPSLMVAGALGPVEIRNVYQAQEFLRNWPVERRGPMWHTARRCCEYAASGLVGTLSARRSLESFARQSRILLDKMPYPAAIEQASLKARPTH
jgi:hypothetical protein